MKRSRFLFLALAIVFAVSTTVAAQTRNILQQVKDIEKEVDRVLATEPTKPTVTVTKDAVVIHASDMNETKDAIARLGVDDSAKPVTIVVARKKPVMHQGRLQYCTSYGKPLSCQFIDALGRLSERSPELLEARQADPTDVRRHVDVAERVLGLDGKGLSIAERTFRITWMGSFDHVRQEITFDFR